MALLPAALLWGASFPLAMAAAAGASSDPARPVGLVYAANVTTDTVSGILGYAVAGSNPGSGVWWGTRPGAPHAALAAAAIPEHDILTSPVKK